MKESFPTDNTIRQYLLGRFDDQDALENRLSERIFRDDELSEVVDSIEDEIIEEYLDGTLSAADRKDVEEYFLCPAQRKEKLRFARLLRDHFQSTVNVRAEADRVMLPELSPAVVDRGRGNALVLHWRSHFRAYCECAALVLIVLSSFIYISSVRREFRSEIDSSRKEQKRLEGELAQVRHRSESLAEQLEQLQPPVVGLTFVGNPRGPEANQVEIRPFTQRIRVEIDLQGASDRAYDVRLEAKARKAIWSQTGVIPSSGALRVEIPVQGMTTGDYHLVISSQPAHSERSHWFHVRVTK